MVTYRANPVIQSVIANLTGAGLIVGDGTKPPAGGQQADDTFVGYCVVHQFSKRFDGSLEAPFDDGSPTISINAFGVTRDQATQVGDRAFTSLTTNPMSIAGRRVALVEPLNDGATDRFDDVQPPIWQDVQRFRIWTTTA